MVICLQLCWGNFRRRTTVEGWRWLCRGGRLSPGCSLPAASFPAICLSTLPSKGNINRPICSLVTSSALLPNQIGTNWKCRVSKVTVVSRKNVLTRRQTQNVLRQRAALGRLPVFSVQQISLGITDRATVNSVLPTLEGLCLTLEILSDHKHKP